MFRKISDARNLFHHLKKQQTLIRHLMEITVSPDEPLVDDNLHITISGLEPKQKITVKSSIIEGKSSFSASACFISDSDGYVHIPQDPSLDGSYKGVDAMGLFWSMLPNPGQQKGQRYTKRDVTTPQLVNISVFEGHHSWNDCNKTNPNHIISKELQRWFLHKTVTREEVRQGKLRGTLFIPQGQGPFPGVIDMFGSAGGLTETRASLLASRGFVSYALPFFKYEDLPSDLSNISFDYFKEAVDWFSNHPMVNKDGIGICGVSKGGEIGLMLTTVCPQIKAIANINGPPFSSYMPLGPFTNHVEANMAAMVETDDGYSLRNVLSDDLTLDKITKTWLSNAKVLYIVGEDDHNVHPKFSELLYSCYPEDQRYKLIIKRYPNAGHLIEPPYNPLCFSSYHKVFGMYFIWGGKPEDHIRAEEDSWLTILNFFKSTLSTNVTSNCLNSHL